MSLYPFDPSLTIVDPFKKALIFKKIKILNLNHCNYEKCLNNLPYNIQLKY
jgi:hypothetical protein